jgi:hypothetical protein
VDITLYEIALNDHREHLRRAEQRRCVEEARRDRQAPHVASTSGPMRFFRVLAGRASRA